MMTSFHVYFSFTRGLSLYWTKTYGFGPATFTQHLTIPNSHIYHIWRHQCIHTCAHVELTLLCWLSELLAQTSPWLNRVSCSCSPTARRVAPHRRNHTSIIRNPTNHRACFSHFFACACSDCVNNTRTQQTHLRACRRRRRRRSRH